MQIRKIAELVYYWVFDPVIPRLPHLFREGKELPNDLIDSKIIAIGTTGDARPEGGGFVIDYLPVSGGHQRIVFRFSECGMWISE